jgi:hypothetical protein
MIFVIRKPEMTKKRSTPVKPPAKPGTSKWNSVTATTATARSPLISCRKADRPPAIPAPGQRICPAAAIVSVTADKACRPSALELRPLPPITHGALADKAAGIGTLVARNSCSPGTRVKGMGISVPRQHGLIGAPEEILMP